MPTYDYACKDCGHRFEAFQSMSDAALTTCPKCERESLQRLIGAGAGLVFKGSGYYLTDYKKSSVPAADSGAETKTESTSSNGNGNGAAAQKAEKSPAKASGKTEPK